MRRALIFALVAALAVGAVRADDDSEKDVKVATDKNWDTLIKSAKYALGESQPAIERKWGLPVPRPSGSGAGQACCLLWEGWQPAPLPWASTSRPIRRTQHPKQRASMPGLRR